MSTKYAEKQIICAPLTISLPIGDQLASQLWACLGVEIADHIENKFGYRQFAGSNSWTLVASQDNNCLARHCCNDGTTLLWPFLQRGESRTYLEKSCHFHFFSQISFFSFFLQIDLPPLSSLRLKLPTLTSCSPNLNRCHPNDAVR